MDKKEALYTFIIVVVASLIAYVGYDYWKDVTTKPIIHEYSQYGGSNFCPNSLKDEGEFELRYYNEGDKIGLLLLNLKSEYLLFRQPDGTYKETRGWQSPLPAKSISSTEWKFWYLINSTQKEISFDVFTWCHYTAWNKKFSCDVKSKTMKCIYEKSDEEYVLLENKYFN